MIKEFQYDDAVKYMIKHKPTEIEETSYGYYLFWNVKHRTKKEVKHTLTLDVLVPKGRGLIPTLVEEMETEDQWDSGCWAIKEDHYKYLANKYLGLTVEF